MKQTLNICMLKITLYNQIENQYLPMAGGPCIAEAGLTTVSFTLFRYILLAWKASNTSFRDSFSCLGVICCKN